MQIMLKCTLMFCLNDLALDWVDAVAYEMSLLPTQWATLLFLPVSF